jgi:hypothetical protein
MKYSISVIIFLFILCNSYSQDVIFKKSFYAQDCYDSEQRIFLVQYKNEIGFRVGAVYFLADIRTFNNTIMYDKKNYKWHVYSRGQQEFLRNVDTVYVLCVKYYDTGLIEFIFTSDFGNSMINHYSIIFNRRHLK